jgi:Uncharacterised protein family (UPF0158)
VIGGRLLDMSAEVKLDAIFEALELANDSISSYLDVETGEVHSITDEEFDLGGTPGRPWGIFHPGNVRQLNPRGNIRQQEGDRYLALPDKFDVHEWAIMDRFAESLKDARLRSDFHGAIRGAGAIRFFKRLLHEYTLWDAWNQFKQVEIRQIATQWCEGHGIM